MKELLNVAAMTLIFAFGAVAPAFADTADDCAQMAIDEAVPDEDLEDFIAECVALVEADSPQEAARALEATAD